jgi:hypothetical protein
VTHTELVEALSHLTAAYTVLGDAIAEALPPSLASATRVDAVSRIVLEEFAAPVVEWFPRGSALRGVVVSDGVVVLDAPAGGQGDVLFLEGLRTTEVPDGWRERARVVGHIDGDRLESASR